jgi:AraC-like DNA-binding protein
MRQMALSELQAILPMSMLIDVADRLYGKGFVRQVTLPVMVSLSDRGLVALLRILKRASQGRPGGPTTRFLAYAVAAHILRTQVANVDLVEARSSSLSLTARQARRIHEYIQANLSRNITIKDLADQTNMSRATLLRRFRVVTGMGVHQLLLEVRAHYAKDLLGQTDLGIASIADHSGFANSSHLSSVFQRFFKTTPAAYRAQVSRSDAASQQTLCDGVDHSSDAVSMQGKRRTVTPGMLELLRNMHRQETSIEVTAQDGVAAKPRQGELPGALMEFRLEQTSLRVDTNIRLVASSQGLGWTDLFAAVTDELPHESIRGAIPAVWLASAVTPTNIQRASAGSIREQILPGNVISIIGAGDSAHDDLAAPLKATHIYLRQKLIDEVREELFETGSGVRYVDSVFGFFDPMLQRMMAAIRGAIKTPCFNNQLEIDYLSCAMAAHLLEQYSNLGLTHRAPPAGALNAREIGIVVDYINANLASNMSVNELAGIIGLVRSQFIGRFKATTSMTPHQFVISRRIGKARRLLAGRSIDLAAIATLCGFANPAHFSTTFRRIVGVTPLEHRRLVT